MRHAGQLTGKLAELQHIGGADQERQRRQARVGANTLEDPDSATCTHHSAEIHHGNVGACRGERLDRLGQGRPDAPIALVAEDLLHEVHEVGLIVEDRYAGPASAHGSHPGARRSVTAGPVHLRPESNQYRPAVNDLPRPMSATATETASSPKPAMANGAISSASPAHAAPTARFHAATRGRAATARKRRCRAWMTGSPGVTDGTRCVHEPTSSWSIQPATMGIASRPMDQPASARPSTISIIAASTAAANHAGPARRWPMDPARQSCSVLNGPRRR